MASIRDEVRAYVDAMSAQYELPTLSADELANAFLTTKDLTGTWAVLPERRAMVRRDVTIFAAERLRELERTKATGGNE